MREELFKPFDPTNKDNLREKLQQMVPLEDKVKDRMDELKAQQEKNKAMEQKLQEMGKDLNQQLAQDGPGKGVEDALNKGDLEKAQQEMKALADKLKNEELKAEDRQKLEQQLDDMKKKLDDIANQQDAKDKLAKDLQGQKIDKEEFDKQMGQLQKDAEKVLATHETPFLIYSGSAITAAFFLAGIWGAGKSTMPLAGAPLGSAFHETVIMAVAYSSAPTGIISFALIPWGLRIGPGQPSSGKA